MTTPGSPHPHDRTGRLLAARLEALALLAERSPGRVDEIEPQVLRAATATRNAVALELLSSEEADAIWNSVAQRHPSVRWAGDAKRPGRAGSLERPNVRPPLCNTAQTALHCG